MLVFYILSDIVHVLGFLFLFAQLRRQHSAKGVSLKTQVLLMVAFVFHTLGYFEMPSSRYTDYGIPTSLLVLLCQLGVVHAVLWHRSTVDSADDVPALYWFLVPCCILGMWASESGRFLAMMGVGSIFLEAVAMVPQLVLIVRTGCRVDGLMALYIVSLVVYKALFTTGWLYEALFRYASYDSIVLVCDSVQYVIFLLFFLFYLVVVVLRPTSMGQNLQLPMFALRDQ
eukprot:m51a1_g5879 putative er lumen protein retaining receptor 3 (228) ;mRNA; r:507588-508521